MTIKLNELQIYFLIKSLNFELQFVISGNDFADLLNTEYYNINYRLYVLTWNSIMEIYLHS